MGDDFDVALRSLVASAETYRSQSSIDGPVHEQIPKQSLRIARKALLDALTNFEQVVAGPIEQWEYTSVKYCHLSSLKWMTTFNIPEYVPLEGAISYQEVAEKAKVPVGQLRRIARFAMTNGLFTEPEPDKIAHTPYSVAFATNKDYQEAVNLQTAFLAPINMKLTEMTSTYGGSLGPNHTAFNLAMESEASFYGHISQNPQLGSQFGSGMRTLAAAEGSGLQYLVEGFDWASLGKAQVVDVGGAMGHASIALAKAFPNLTMTVQDLPATIGKAKTQPLPPGVTDRLVFTAHDFFKPQPESSAEASVFLLRLIVNNWPTPLAQQILANVAAAMKPGALIVLNHFILPRPGTRGKRTEAMERTRDLFMMAAMNGMERDEDQWHELVNGVEGLKIKQITQPLGTTIAIIVVEKMQ